MKITTNFFAFAVFLLTLNGACLPAGAAALRPPAVPLVACDPYFSIWSPADKLTDADTVHWTGKPHRLTSMVRIDDKGFRLMGKDPAAVPAMTQTDLNVLPTRTIYTFEDAGVNLTLTFTTPALPDDISILSRPVTYLTWEARSLDARSHSVRVYFDANPEIAVNEPNQEVSYIDKGLSRSGDSGNAALPGLFNVGLHVLGVGSVEQPILQKKGDDLRIDWGYLYVAATKGRNGPLEFPCLWHPDQDMNRETWAKSGTVVTKFRGVPQPAKSGLNLVQFLDLGTVSSAPVSRWLILAYDDLYSIQYMKKNLRPYWRKNGWEAADLLAAAAADYQSLAKRCEAFDAELMADLTRAGGESYARIAALAYRQCFAAGKFVADANGQPIQFCKENHSNGCIGTSDLLYPMAPQFLLFGPTLAKSFLVPFMNYAACPRWSFPFAPHDLGTYPMANGQVYGGGERTEENQMPVEESGNLLLLMGAVAQMEGNPSFPSLYWPQLQKWADYLKAKGFDPENQLCTDDFAGHLAHNVNLSAKAICALASFAKLCQMRGDSAKADEYFALASSFAQRWVKEADDGEKFRLAFDRPGTWSQKYNLIWDRILGLNIFPPDVARKEMDFYKKNQNPFGLPLDSRKAYTKLDWTLWTATLTQNRADFEALVEPVYRFVNQTPDRSPMTDWFQTKDARKVGFTARPVIGGVFAQLLYDKPAWAKYAARDCTRAANWAPIPTPPKTTTVLPAADKQQARWRYTTSKPAPDWFQPAFDCSSWTEGNSGFGTRGTPGAVIGTAWNTSDIWLRREVELSEPQLRSVQAWVHHDEDFELYLNGVPALKARGYSTGYDLVPLSEPGGKALKPGKNLIAIHCHQTSGGQYIDFGLSSLESN